jgi:hypothetical protein
LTVSWRCRSIAQKVKARLEVSDEGRIRRGLEMFNLGCKAVKSDLVHALTRSALNSGRVRRDAAIAAEIATGTTCASVFDWH